MNNQAWKRLHARYEREAYRIIMRHVKEQLKKIPLTDLTNAELTVEYNVNDNFAIDMLKDVYQVIGLKHGKLMDKQIEDGITKDYRKKPLFSTVWQRFILEFLSSEAGLSKVKIISGTFKETVKNLLIKMVEENFTVTQMAKALASPQLYKWEAMRIARTETTFTASASASKVSESSLVRQEKTWMSGGYDGVTRESHIQMDNVTVDAEEDFIVGGSRMAYPGDQKGPAEEVVNCRCRIVYTSKKNPDGSLMFKENIVY